MAGSKPKKPPTPGKAPVPTIGGKKIRDASGMSDRNKRTADEIKKQTGI